MSRDPYKYFRVEARELIEQLSGGILELERGAAAAGIVHKLLRVAHTLKGAARVVKQGAIADNAHSMESLLVPFRDSASPVSGETIEALLRLLDQMTRQLSSLDLAAPAPPAESQRDTAPFVAEEVFRGIRADSGDMDNLLRGITEACVQLGSLRKRLGVLEKAGHLSSLLGEQLASARDGRPSADALLKFKARSMAEELTGLLTGLERDAIREADRLDLELLQLRENVEHLRLIPAAVLFSTLARAVRDTAQAVRRSAVFEGIGGEVRIDGEVLATLQGALIQLVRNAVAHGIENQAERKARGKNPAGKVVLRVRRAGRFVTFACSDDGNGVDLNAVRAAAQRRGLLSGAAATESRDREELLQAMLQSGVSTAATTTEVAGRGIGLDIVREAAVSLGGQVQVRTETGKGTTIEISVPLLLASLDALIVESGENGTTAAIPVDSIRRTVRLARSDISRTAESHSMMFDGQVVPFLPLNRILAPAEKNASKDNWSVVVIGGRNGLAALGVERMVGVAKMVLRPLPELAVVPPAVAGAAMDAEGNPLLVLDPDGLIAEAHEPPAGTEESALKRAPILVVDDSLTTRMLEQSILESAGFEVDVAASGEEGMAKAKAKRYGLFLVDVEMPGMDGFTFVRQTRQMPALHDIPAVLVTSLAAPEDREKGFAAGAAAYIVKSEFEQNGFVRLIRGLVV